MHTHSRRWEKAQEVERLYWRKEYFRDSEFKELKVKYSSVLRELEDRYGFSDSTRILDLGCGATCPSTLFSKGMKYGVDPLVDSFPMKDREKLQGKIELVKGTGEEIPFEKDFFDVALCRNALDHMDNIDRVMEEIKRVTRPGGIVILSIYTYTPFIAFLKETSEYVPYLRNVEHPFTFTPEGFSRFSRKFFDPIEEKIIFEGKNSIDYGKKDVELTEPLLHKIFAWTNRYVFMNRWFLRELLLVLRNKESYGG